MTRLKVFLWVGPGWGAVLAFMATILYGLRWEGLGNPDYLIFVALAHGVPIGVVVGVVMGLLTAFAYGHEGLHRFARPILVSSAIGALPLAPFIGPMSALTGAIGYLIGIMIVKSDPHAHRTSPPAPGGAPGNAHSAQEELK